MLGRTARIFILDYYTCGSLFVLFFEDNMWWKRNNCILNDTRKNMKDLYNKLLLLNQVRLKRKSY